MSNHVGEQGPVQGTVAPGFESVKGLYERETLVMAEENTQLCVYHKGEKVVDLWRSTALDADFSADSLVNVFSSGKSLETIAIASLVGKGLLAYEDKIADHWPEFAAHGKGELTVADLMRHEGGLAAFDTSLDVADLLPENIKQNRVGALIERQHAKFRKGDDAKREYHAVTRGWIVNELFRRVDSAGRTVGEFLREEISRPLEADAIIGVEEAELGRISKVRPLGFGYMLLQSLRPRFLGRKLKLGFLRLFTMLLRIFWSLRHATTHGAPPPYKGIKSITFFNQPAVAMGETPSAAANCSARGLAKIAAMMSARGTWSEREYLSKDAWEALHANPLEGDMGFAPTNFTQGGVNRFSATAAQGSGLERAFNEGREGFYGWMGLGGSIFQWHPEQQIGFAFVPTSLHVVDILNERGKVYQAEVLRCVERSRGVN
jgi:CubicO group peptidase (beta-lactamase class C family)